MEELFTIPEVLSPRLQWLKEKGVSQVQLLKEGEECPETGNEGPLWATWYGECPLGPGASKAQQKGSLCYTTDAVSGIERLSMRNNWRLWNQP